MVVVMTPPSRAGTQAGPLRTIPRLPDDTRGLTTWCALSHSHQREYVRAIEEAKRFETRQRRIDETLKALLKRERG